MKYNYPLFKVFVDVPNAMKEIRHVLTSGFVNEGVQVSNFVDKMRTYFDYENIVPVNSCTSALTLAMKLSGVGHDTEVIAPSMTCFATLAPIHNLGATPVWADIDSKTGNIDLDSIKDKLTDKTKAIVCVNWAGLPCDLDKLYQFCFDNDIKLIQDAAHSMGALYKDKHICHFADFTCYSLQAIKHITTGEGGAITTNDTNLFQKIKLFKSHGIIRSKQNKHWEYDIKTAGLNFRLSDLNCALGLSQLKKIDSFLRERKNIAKFYEREFKKLNLNITFPLVNKVQSAWHLYIINYNFKNLKSKNNFFKHLKKNNIIAQFHYIPIYRLSIGKNFKKLPGCEKYYKNSVSLPIFVGLKKRQQLVIINTIKNYLQKIN